MLINRRKTHFREVTSFVRYVTYDRAKTTSKDSPSVITSNQVKVRQFKGLGPVAQLVEHRTFNAVVAGSSPARLTTYKLLTIKQLLVHRLAVSQIYRSCGIEIQGIFLPRSFQICFELRLACRYPGSIVTLGDFDA